MSPKFQRDLKKKSQYLVQIKRRAGMHSLFGFVVDYSDELVLLNSFKSDVFCLNGYEVIRLSDIRDYCFFDDPRYWRFKALRRLKIKPVKPEGICLASVKELLASVAAGYPLMSVHREMPKQWTTFVGPIVTRSERSFTIEDADYYGQWTGPRRMRYADVSLVCFDGGYLNASAMTMPKLPKYRA